MSFPYFFLLLTSAILLWPQNILCMILVLLNLLKCVLWPNMCTLGNVPCPVEENTYSVIFKYSMHVCSSWFIVLFKSSVYKMTYCLVVLSIIESGIVKTQLFC